MDREAAHFGAHGRRLVGPQRRVGDAAQAEPGAARLYPRQIDQHWQLDEHGLRPLAGKTALDVGCGAGLLAEPLARLGAAVTAVDAAPELIAVGARRMRRGRGWPSIIAPSAVEAVEGKFDLVTAMEVIEHVADPAPSSTASPRGWRPAAC